MKHLIIESLEKIQKSNRINQDIMINIDLFSVEELTESYDLTSKEVHERFSDATFFLSFDCSEDFLPLSKNSDLKNEITNWMKAQNLI